MSLCYDFQKWTMISLSVVAISATIGLILLVGKAYGQALITKEPSNIPELITILD